MTQVVRQTFHWLIAVAVSCFLLGCAIGQEVVNHGFGFDLRQDGQDAVILDYRYGNSKLPVHAPEWAVKEGKTFVFEGVTGPMLRGEFLYVKWRNKNTGQIYEDTVDLRHRLPKDIANHEIYLMIRGPQLYVYLISPERRPPDMPPNGPSTYDYRKITTIYPDQTKP